MAQFFVTLFIGIAISAIVWARRRSQRADEAWVGVARRLGLRFKPGAWTSPRSLRGTYRGLEVVVDTYRQRAGNSSKTYTRYRVRYPSLGLGLKVRKEGLLSKMTQFLGMHDIQVGDPVFDAEVLVKGRLSSSVKEFLTPVRQRTLQRLIRAYPRCVVTDTEIKWSRAGVATSEEEVVSNLRRLVDAGRVLVGAGQETEQVDQALREQERGRIGNALEALQPPAEAPTQDPMLESRALEGELLYTSGRYEQASKVFEEVERELPEDPEIREWSRLASERKAAPPQPPPAAEPETAATQPEIALDCVAVCEDVFGTDRLGHEINRIFEEKYLGKSVRWSGRLTGVDPYSYDYVFGSGPAVKAIVEVHDLGSDVYGGRRVDAIVSLTGEAEKLRARIGEDVVFEGMLLRCDSLMRNIYVEHGRLVAS